MVSVSIMNHPIVKYSIINYPVVDLSLMDHTVVKYFIINCVMVKYFMVSYAVVKCFHNNNTKVKYSVMDYVIVGIPNAFERKFIWKKPMSSLPDLIVKDIILSKEHEYPNFSFDFTD